MPKYSFTAREVQALLDGFVCLFKPRDMSISTLERMFLKEVCNQANQLAENRPLPTIQMPIVEAHPSGALMVVGKRDQIDYSMHPLIVGRMFEPEDVQIEALNYLEPSSSGVCLFGLNTGCDQLERVRDQSWISEYILEAELGRQTYKNAIRGKVNFQATYDHVTMHKMNKALAMVRMQFKKTAFQFANVDMQSQEAFELARQGAPRPKVLGSPLVYGVELLDGQFKAPRFKLRVQVAGESDKFLRDFVHEIGCSLHTVASPRRLRRVRQGPFSLEHGLLEKHFHLESVLKNVLMSSRIVANSLAKQRSEVIRVESEEETKELRQLLVKYRLTGKELEAEVLPEEEDCLRLPFGRHYETC